MGGGVLQDGGWGRQAERVEWASMRAPEEDQSVRQRQGYPPDAQARNVPGCSPVKCQQYGQTVCRVE